MIASKERSALTAYGNTLNALMAERAKATTVRAAVETTAAQAAFRGWQVTDLQNAYANLCVVTDVTDPNYPKGLSRSTSVTVTFDADFPTEDVDESTRKTNAAQSLAVVQQSAAEMAAADCRSLEFADLSVRKKTLDTEAGAALEAAEALDVETNTEATERLSATDAQQRSLVTRNDVVRERAATYLEALEERQNQFADSSVYRAALENEGVFDGTSAASSSKTTPLGAYLKFVKAAIDTEVEAAKKHVARIEGLDIERFTRRLDTRRANVLIDAATREETRAAPNIERFTVQLSSAANSAQEGRDADVTLVEEVARELSARTEDDRAQIAKKARAALESGADATEFNADVSELVTASRTHADDLKTRVEAQLTDIETSATTLTALTVQADEVAQHLEEKNV